MFRALRGQKSLFVDKPLVKVRLHDMAGRITSSEFDTACARQYSEFCGRLTEREIEDMFGDASTFYYRIAAMIMARGLRSPALDLINANKKYFLNVPVSTADFLSRDYKSICIFGAAFQGRFLLFELKGRGVNVDCFIDNNARLHNKKIAGLNCIPLSELVGKSQILAIVSPDDSDGIVERLKDSGVKNIMTKKQLERKFLETPPFCWEAICDEMAE